ncbi:MAG: glycosyltransferase 87 family protein [Terracidiphilus sp.]|nr:glycosyltransferase 87 family protein [Terracidiphilus sp.]
MKKPLRVLAAAAIVAAGLCFVVVLYMVGLSDKNAAGRDFISYWAAGQLLVHGKNPYDFQAARSLELAAGRDPAEPLLMMRNPPVAFFVALPLGLLSPKTALILWLLVLLGGLSLALLLVWVLHGKPDNRFHLLGYVFAPVLACFQAGQFGIFLLLGVVLFLYFHRTRPYLAGAALLLCSLKPHLFFPFGVALILWSIAARTGRILAGFAAALAASCALSYVLDKNAWAQYAQMMHLGGALDEAVPALSVYFRMLVSPHTVWLQFVPEACASVFAAGYFWTRRTRWNWLDHGLVLLLVGAMCTPFGWLTDESMLLPAVLAGVYCALAARRSLVPIAVVAAAALAEFFFGPKITTPWFLWTTPAWLLWYLYATGRFGGQSAPAGGIAAAQT